MQERCSCNEQPYKQSYSAVLQLLYAGLELVRKQHWKSSNETLFLAGYVAFSNRTLEFGHFGQCPDIAGHPIEEVNFSFLQYIYLFGFHIARNVSK